MSWCIFAEKVVQLLFNFFEHGDFVFVFIVELVDGGVHFFYFFFDLHFFFVQL